MKLNVNIHRSGLVSNLVLSTDTSTALFMSPRAAYKIYEQMMQNGNICTVCKMICRSDELVNGECIIGTGHTIDTEERILRGGAVDENEISRLANDTWHTFLMCLPRRDDPQEPMPAPDPDTLQGKVWF